MALVLFFFLFFSVRSFVSFLLKHNRKTLPVNWLHSLFRKSCQHAGATETRGRDLTNGWRAEEMEWEAAFSVESQRVREQKTPRCHMVQSTGLNEAWGRPLHTGIIQSDHTWTNTLISFKCQRYGIRLLLLRRRNEIERGICQIQATNQQRLAEKWKMTQREKKSFRKDFNAEETSLFFFFFFLLTPSNKQSRRQTHRKRCESDACTDLEKMTQ